MNQDLIKRLKATGAHQTNDGVWVGKLPSIDDAHEAADVIAHQDAQIRILEETVRYLNSQVTKGL